MELPSRPQGGNVGTPSPSKQEQVVPEDEDDLEKANLAARYNPTLASILYIFGSSQVGVGSDQFALELDDNSQDQYTNKRVYTHLNILHQLFIVAEHPQSSLLGKLWSLTVAMVTLSSVVIFIIESMPEMQYIPKTCTSPVCNQDPLLCPGRIMCAPQTKSQILFAEENCIYFFLVDYFVRVLLVGMVPSHIASVAPEPKTGSEESVLDNVVMGVWTREKALGYHVDDLDPARAIAFDLSLKIVQSRLVAMNDKVCMWMELADATAEKNSPLQSLIVYLARPMTETNYHPAQDPVFAWWRQILLYVFKLMNLVDFLAVLPWFLNFLPDGGGPSFSVVRVLRLARVLRVLKLGKGFKGMVILFETVRDSGPALAILGFFSLIGVVLLGTIQYFCEGGTFDFIDKTTGPEYYRVDKTGLGQEQTPYDSIPASMYWVVITSTTVGFGDLFPTTYWGRLIAIIAAYGGMFTFALPISVIGHNFERIYDVAQGHLSQGVVFSICELMSDESDVTQLIRSSEFERSSAQKRMLSIIQLATKKLVAVFILAKNLLSSSRMSHFIGILKELHIGVYLEALIFLEEERLVKVKPDLERSIDPEVFTRGDDEVPGDTGNQFWRSRDLLLSLGMLHNIRSADPSLQIIFSGDGQPIESLGTAEVLAEGGDKLSEEDKEKRQRYKTEMSKLDAQLNIALAALEDYLSTFASPSSSSLTPSQSSSDLHQQISATQSRLQQRHAEEMRQIEEDRSRRTMTFIQEVGNREKKQTEKMLLDPSRFLVREAARMQPLKERCTPSGGSIKTASDLYTLKAMLENRLAEEVGLGGTLSQGPAFVSGLGSTDTSPPATPMSFSSSPSQFSSRARSPVLARGKYRALSPNTPDRMPNPNPPAANASPPPGGSTSSGSTNSSQR